MRISLPSFAAGALVATVLVAIPATAMHGARTAADTHPRKYDGTAPVLALQRPRFIIGRSIDAAEADGCQVANFGVPERLQWIARDPGSGLTGFEVWQIGASSPPARVATLGSGSRHYDFSTTNYDGLCGGGQEVNNYLWLVTHDNRGNTAATTRVSEELRVWQEDGVDPIGGGDLPFVRSSGWSSASCGCYNNAKLLYSTARGSRLTYTIESTAPGQVVGVVVDKNSSSGRMWARVDKGKPTAVPTFSSTARHRVIVWQQALSVGTHTLRLTNAGTSGHPRVAVDSLLLTPGPTNAPPPDPGE
jgi:hypothetical protein